MWHFTFLVLSALNKFVVQRSSNKLINLPPVHMKKKVTHLRHNIPDTYNITNFIVIDSIIFAGGYGGVYVSTNNGENWTINNNGFIGPYLVVTGFCITNSTLFVGLYTNGIYFSSDYGLSWGVSDSGLTNNDIISLATNGLNIYVGTGYGMFKSIDSGKSWTDFGLTEPSGLLHFGSLVIYGSHIFAGTSRGVWRRALL